MIKFGDFSQIKSYKNCNLNESEYELQQKLNSNNYYSK